MARVFSPGGVSRSAGTTSDPLIDQPIPSTARPNGACASAVPGLVAPAMAGAAPTGTWKTSQGIAAAMSSTAECVANRGAAYFSRTSPFSPPTGRELRLTQDKLPRMTMACIGATSYYATVTQPLPAVRNQKPGHWVTNSGIAPPG